MRKAIYESEIAKNNDEGDTSSFVHEGITITQNTDTDPEV